MAGVGLRPARADTGSGLSPWVSAPSLQIGVAGPVVVQTKGVVRAIGGVATPYSDSHVYTQAFDPSVAHPAWTLEGNFTYNTSHQGMAGAALPDGRIIVEPGATNQTPDWYTEQAFIGRSYTYDPASQGWAGGTPPQYLYYPPLGQYRSSAVMASDGNVYFVGGDLTNSHAGRAVVRFTTTTGLWDRVAALPRGAIGAAVVADGAGHIYAIGGQADSVDQTTVHFLPYAYVYDVTSPASGWQSIPSLPHALGAAAAVMGPDGMIYVMGGEDASGGLASVYALNPLNPGPTGTWVEQSSLPQPVADAGATTTSDGHVYLVGGTPNGLRIGYPDFRALATVYTATIASPGTSGSGAAGVSTPELPAGDLAALAALPCVALIWQRRRQVHPRPRLQ